MTNKVIMKILRVTNIPRFPYLALCFRLFTDQLFIVPHQHASWEKLTLQGENEAIVEYAVAFYF
jgi:hypothetical protein